MSEQIEITQNAIVGPDDRVILCLPSMSHEQAGSLARQLQRLFGDDRAILIVGDTVHVSVVKPRVKEITG